MQGGVLMKVRWILLSIGLAILVGWGCSAEGPSAVPSSPNVVASFHGGVITKEQLRARFDDLMPCCKGRYQGEEGTRTLNKGDGVTLCYHPVHQTKKN